jgi:general stress protein CsbA
LSGPNIRAFARIVGYLVILFLGRDIFFNRLLHMILITILNIAVKAFKKYNNIFFIVSIDAFDMIYDVIFERRKSKPCELG